MLFKKYKLSDQPIPDDIISNNIFKRRDKIYWNIKNFSSQSKNDGIFAENILRLTLDGVNLNHLSKNHPHVDIAIVNPIEGFSEKNEIISVKSSISKSPTLRNLLSDTKSIKLESMFSYIMFANSNYELHYDRDFFSPRKLLQDAISLIRTKQNKDYKAVINTTIFYLLKKNKKEERINFVDDINKIGDKDYNLTYGTYKNYRIKVLRRLVHLNAPISLGALFLKNTTDGETCFIYKTNPIRLNKYWEKLVDIWLDEEFFEYDTTKYLNLSLVKDLFGMSQSDEFPIQIKISIGEYNPDDPGYADKTESEKIEIAKQKADKKTNKLYVATKFKDSDFGDRSSDVNNFFLKSIDILEKEPNLITKFNSFVSSIQNPPLNKWWS